MPRRAQIDDEASHHVLAPAAAEQVDDERDGDGSNDDVVRPEHGIARAPVGQAFDRPEDEHPGEARRGRKRLERSGPRRARRPQEAPGRRNEDGRCERQRDPAVRRERFDRPVDVRRGDDPLREPRPGTSARIGEDEVDERPAVEIERPLERGPEKPRESGEREQSSDPARGPPIPRDRARCDQHAAHREVGRGERRPRVARGMRLGDQPEENPER
jgi:hypothetical protein